MKKNILIIGNSAKEASLAKILSEQFEVFVAPGNDGMKSFATIVDIRETNTIELLNFALENDIYFTIASSKTAIKKDIYNLFDAHELMIFAPSEDAAEFTINKSIAKKIFYKLHIPTPKFAIYEKKNLALDYIKKIDMPVVIKTDEEIDKNSVMVCPNKNIAKSYIEDCFLNNESKIIIEDYVYGQNFSFYVITDGYKALPLGSVEDYKFSLDGDGGVFTSGMGASSPYSKLTYDHEDYLMNEVVYPIVNYLADEEKTYMGIIGFDCVLTPNGDIAIIECTPFLKDHDCQAVLSLLDDDIFKLMHSCTIGSFSDEYDYLNTKDEYAVSLVLSSGKSKNDIIEGLDELQDETIVHHLNTKQNEYTEYETLGDRALVLTTTARTMGRACSKVYEEADLINFNGKYYRKDICKVLI